jgi:hypothetical protein
MITLGKENIWSVPWKWQNGYSGWIYKPEVKGDRWSWMLNQYRSELRGHLVLQTGEGDSLSECVAQIEERLLINARSEQMLLSLS